MFSCFKTCHFSFEGLAHLYYFVAHCIPPCISKTHQSPVAINLLTQNCFCLLIHSIQWLGERGRVRAQKQSIAQINWIEIFWHMMCQVHRKRATLLETTLIAFESGKWNESTFNLITLNASLLETIASFSANHRFSNGWKAASSLCAASHFLGRKANCLQMGGGWWKICLCFFRFFWFTVGLLCLWMNQFKYRFWEAFKESSLND